MTAKGKAVEKKEEAKEVTPIDLIQYARQSFGNMQRGWWEFAKSIHKIRKEETWSKKTLGDEDGFDSFKDFCNVEFPSIDLATLYKFCSIVDEWQDIIDAKLKKDPMFRLPAYESCYKLVTAQSDLDKEEISRLRKSLIEEKVSYHGLKVQLKDLIARKLKEVTKSADEEEATVRAIEEDLTHDIADEVGGDDDDVEDFTVPADDDFDDIEEGEDLMGEDEDEDAAGVTSCTARAQYLIDNLPAVEMTLKKGGKKTKELEELAEKLESLSEIANNFFTKYEKLK